MKRLLDRVMIFIHKIVTSYIKYNFLYGNIESVDLNDIRKDNYEVDTLLKKTKKSSQNGSERLKRGIK